MNLFKELNRRHIEIIVEATGKKISEIKGVLKQGKILSTNQAKNLGIVHEIKDKFSTPIPTPVQPTTSQSSI